MTQDDAFLEAIIDSPEDDGLRLIYADWLEEQGDPRGEFVRVQVELARLTEQDPRWAGLAEREAQLLDEHGWKWLRPLKRLLPEEDCTPVFQRGLVAEVTFWGGTGAVRLLVVADKLFRQAPVQSLRFLPVGGHGGKTFPWDRRPKLVIDRLSFGQLQSILRLPQLAGLRLLDLSGSTLESPDGRDPLFISNALGDFGAVELAGCPHLRGLRQLLLANNVIRDAGARALVDSPNLKQLTTLDLSGNDLSADLVEEFRWRRRDRQVNV